MIQRIIQAFRKPDPRIAAAPRYKAACEAYRRAETNRDKRGMGEAYAIMHELMPVVLRGRG